MASGQDATNGRAKWEAQSTYKKKKKFDTSLAQERNRVNIFQIYNKTLTKCDNLQQQVTLCLTRRHKIHSLRMYRHARHGVVWRWCERNSIRIKNPNLIWLSHTRELRIFNVLCPKPSIRFVQHKVHLNGRDGESERRT